METRTESPNDKDTPGFQKEPGLPKIGTHALGLDEDNAIDPNEAEQVEDEDQNRGNQAGEFEVAAGVQDAGNSLHVDAV